MIKGSSATANLRVVFPAKKSIRNSPVIKRCSVRNPIHTAVSNKNSAVRTTTGNASLAEGKISFLIIVSLIIYSNAQCERMLSD
jgi:hypothetical protein